MNAEAGRCWSLLGEHHRAAECAEAAMRAFQERLPRSAQFNQVHAAEAYLGLGELDHALDFARAAIPMRHSAPPARSRASPASSTAWIHTAPAWRSESSATTCEVNWPLEVLKIGYACDLHRTAWQTVWTDSRSLPGGYRTAVTIGRGWGRDGGLGYL